MHQAHVPAMILSITLAGLGLLIAYLMYQWKKIDPDKFAEKINPFYKFSLNKWYLDEIYHATFVAGTIGISRLLSLFDNYVVDGIVNGTAFLTRWFSKINGIFDNVVVDGLVNFIAYLSGFFGVLFRKLQTGKVQTYVVFVVFSIIILLFIFKPF